MEKSVLTLEEQDFCSHVMCYAQMLLELEKAQRETEAGVSTKEDDCEKSPKSSDT